MSGGHRDRSPYRERYDRGDRGDRYEERRNERSSDSQHRERPYSRDNDRARDYLNETENKANNSIMLRGMAITTDEEKVRDYVKPFGTVTFVKLLREHKSGVSRGIGFVEFETPKEANDFLRHHKADGGRTSRIKMDGKWVDIKYSRPKAQIGANNDWICQMCNGTNFPSRIECWTCCAPKGVEREAVKATPFLFISNLYLNTPAPIIESYCTRFQRVKSIQLGRHVQSSSRRDALVQFFSANDAKEVLYSMKQHIIDDSRVTMRFANKKDIATFPKIEKKRNEPKKEIKGAKETSFALGAAEIVPVVTPPSIVLSVPDVEDFEYNSQMNGLFNAKTNLYYDTSSGYFFNTVTQQYHYFDPSKKAYFQYEHSQREETPLETPTSEIESQKQVKSRAPKTAKVMADINKWHAKSKEMKPKVKVDPPIQPTTSNVEPKPQEIIPMNKEKPKDPPTVLELLQKRYEKPTGHICLLCKRNLISTEKLLVHFKLSNLHAANLALAVTKQQDSLENKTIGVKRRNEGESREMPPLKMLKRN